MSKINPKSLVSILTVICIVISMICSKPIRAVTEGRVLSSGMNGDRLNFILV